MAFVLPTEDERVRAIGSLTGLPAEVQRAFDPGGQFDPVPPPGRFDWLSIARERGQTFERFARTTANRLDARQRIYLQPFGAFGPEESELLDRLRHFGGAFFARDVQLLEAAHVDSSITTRRNRFTDVLQLKTRDLLPWLARRVPADACCLLGVTAFDLYPHDTWSFVFGEALVDDRVGVFSVARYDPRFYGKAADADLLLTRSCKVLAHETCHMLGMRHCVYFNCLMNGSNHLEESDRRPLHLCPVDLRKLHWSLGFDIVHRYERLLAFWRQTSAAGEVRWLEQRLQFIEQPGRRPLGATPVDEPQSEH